MLYILAGHCLFRFIMPVQPKTAVHLMFLSLLVIILAAVNVTTNMQTIFLDIQFVICIYSNLMVNVAEFFSVLAETQS